jgi:uncharacterized protein (TIGR02145 family)
MNAAPAGWHLPSDEDWTTLTTYLSGESVAGGKLKESGTIHWNSPNTGAINETGFTARPGGYRNYVGTFGNAGNYCYWWSSTGYDVTDAWGRSLLYNSASVYRNYFNKKLGISVRCVRDN